MEKKPPPLQLWGLKLIIRLCFSSVCHLWFFSAARCSRSVVRKGAGLHGVHKATRTDEERRSLILPGGKSTCRVEAHLRESGLGPAARPFVPREPTVVRSGWGWCSRKCVETGVCVNAHQRRAERDVSAPLQGSWALIYWMDPDRSDKRRPRFWDSEFSNLEPAARNNGTSGRLWSIRAAPLTPTQQLHTSLEEHWQPPLWF